MMKTSLFLLFSLFAVSLSNDWRSGVCQFKLNYRPNTCKKLFKSKCAHAAGSNLTTCDEATTTCWQSPCGSNGCYCTLSTKCDTLSPNCTAKVGCAAWNCTVLDWEDCKQSSYCRWLHIPKNTTATVNTTTVTVNTTAGGSGDGANGTAKTNVTNGNGGGLKKNKPARA
jgi:hypothetical protein